MGDSPDDSSRSHPTERFLRDTPEYRLMQRTLAELQLDPTLALAVLLKSLADNHLKTAPDAHDSQPLEYTVYEAVHWVLVNEGRRNGEISQRELDRGTGERELDGPAGLACALYIHQDEVRELVARCLDHVGFLDQSSDTSEEDPPEPPPMVRLAA